MSVPSFNMHVCRHIKDSCTSCLLMPGNLGLVMGDVSKDSTVVISSQCTLG